VNRKQYILIGSGILLIGLLYFFGNRKGSQNPPQASAHNDAANAEMPGNPADAINSIDFASYSIEATNKLSAEDKKTAQQLTDKAEKEKTAITFKDIAEFWEKQNDLNMAANYYKKAAFLENTEKSVTFAGNLFLAVMQKTEQPEIRKWQALEAIGCFNKALELNPDNADTKIALATCYTEGTGETMKGVTLLREVTQKDSNNISANIVLGKLAIQSGQFDKAIKRLELVLSLRPENTEAMYFLAEAYKGSGNKEKAISLFEKCKKIVNNPEFTKEVDNYMNSFK